MQGSDTLPRNEAPPSFTLQRAVSASEPCVIPITFACDAACCPPAHAPLTLKVELKEMAKHAR